jgi:3-dehydroquinate synthetase
LDKKVRERAIKWVLLEGIGQTTIRDDVPQEYVVGVLNEILT